jgi:excisionase family DNA binding protein
LFLSLFTAEVLKSFDGEPTDPMPSFVTLQEAAKTLKLPTHRSLKMIHRKELPSLLVGSHWRISLKRTHQTDSTICLSSARCIITSSV